MREKPLILIVDDDADFRDVLKTKLTVSGFAVEEAENGELGVERAKALIPDLIVMDVKMPKMDGVEAMTRILQSGIGKEVKIIFLTAFGDPQPDIYGIDQRFAKEVGALDYFVKTEDLAKITDKIRKILNPS